LQIALARLRRVTHEDIPAQTLAHRAYAFDHALDVSTVGMQGADDGSPAETMEALQVHRLAQVHLAPGLIRRVASGGRGHENEGLHALRWRHAISRAT
jgi:hypothetical protein